MKYIALIRLKISPLRPFWKVAGILQVIQSMAEIGRVECLGLPVETPRFHSPIWDGLNFMTADENIGCSND